MTQLLSGIAASGGIAIAPVHLLGENSPGERRQSTNDVNHEVARLHDSFRITAQKLAQIAQQAATNFGPAAHGALKDQLRLVNDWALQAEISRRVVRDKVSAAKAIEAELAQRLANLPAPARQARAQAIALHDVARQFKENLSPTGAAKLDHRAIVIVEEATPSLVAGLDPRLVAGLVTDRGGVTAHSALLTAELGIPAVVGTKQATTLAREDMVAIIDGHHGKVILQPTPQQIDHYQQLLAQEARQRQELGDLRTQATVTADGNHFHVAANVTLPRELTQLAQSGAEGIGLYRSEYLFVDASHPVTEAEQEAAYKQALLAQPNSRVVIRVQDLGADKLPDLASGLATGGGRGIRRLLADPAPLRTQLRALLKASVYGQLAIMFPFVTTVAEFQKALVILDQEKRRLEKTGQAVADQIEVGMMVETPAAVFLADQFARYADFFSIGSNDLGQYLFAADRQQAGPDPDYSALNPAMLRAIRRVITAAHAEGKWVSLCGAMADQPVAQPLLVAMGLDEFSVPPAAILPLRQRIRQLSVRQLQPLVKQALQLESADEVADLVNQTVMVKKS